MKLLLIEYLFQLHDLSKQMISNVISGTYIVETKIKFTFTFSTALGRDVGYNCKNKSNL